MHVIAVDKPDVSPLEMPARFRHDVAYFMTPPGEGDAPPKLPPGEYWIRSSDAETWLTDGVLRLYSPLDSEKQAEVEITAEQEEFLAWLVQHKINHVRIVS